MLLLNFLHPSECVCVQQHLCVQMHVCAEARVYVWCHPQSLFCHWTLSLCILLASKLRNFLFCLPSARFIGSRHSFLCACWKTKLSYSCLCGHPPCVPSVTSLWFDLLVFRVCVVLVPVAFVISTFSCKISFILIFITFYDYLMCNIVNRW